MDQNEKSAKGITVTYDDGSVKELDKGIVFTIREKEETDQLEITADMLNMSGDDFLQILSAVVVLAEKLGML